MRFADKVVVVTGGAHGIGRATVERFLAEGARVALLDIDVDAAEQASKELSTDTGDGDARVFVAGCDILDAASVDAAVASVVEHYGRIDVLASVAGGDIVPDDPLGEAHWNTVVSWNLHGPVRLIRACLSQLKQSHGAIVLVGSVNGIQAFGQPAYSSAKAGLSLLARNLAVTLGPDGVRINVVAPGTVRTRVWDNQRGGADALLPLYPLGRVGEPADIASAIAFLASADAAWITGVTLPVDGGATVGPLAALPREP
ncbi:SDR family NAD(P)-dependent oxidoreductase [Rathayibacter soli]|uniref:SDR family NAD(P)-dependent oxidoreductase n=1 Tax=Rathayibacter soli TaxID=3144168 RepID=UPI0027E48B13|nr:SDR family oxidoreductase [Glaciibacter superstes]